jgi:hypothetical protein
MWVVPFDVPEEAAMSTPTEQGGKLVNIFAQANYGEAVATMAGADNDRYLEAFGHIYNSHTDELDTDETRVLEALFIAAGGDLDTKRALEDAAPFSS